MKKAYMILWVLVIFPAFFLVNKAAAETFAERTKGKVIAEVSGGTFIAGAKVWYETTWDSALLNIYDELLTDSLTEIPRGQGGFYNVESKIYAGSGYLAGPVLGYQSSNKIWSVSFAPMVTSHFSQQIKGSVLMDLDLFGTGDMVPITGNMETIVDVTRLDFDLAGSYSLAQFKDRFFLFEYCKVFAGFKYQDISYDFTFTAQVADFKDTGTRGFDYNVYMPTVGVGIVYPFSEDIVAGVQVGHGVAHFSGIDVEDSLATNIEANVTVLPIDNLIVQFGYRYQQFSFDLKIDGKTYTSNDITYGPTLTAIYILVWIVGAV